jgi:hypothetical protein
VIGKVADGDYVRPGRVIEGFPAALEAVIARALEVEPERRYPTAAALVADLQRFATGARLDVEAPARAALLVQRFGFEPPPVVDLAALLPATPPPPVRRARASPLRWVGLAVVGVAIGGVGFVVGGLSRGEAGSTVTAPADAIEPDPAVVAAPEPTTPAAARPAVVHAIDGGAASPPAAEDPAALELAADEVALDDDALEGSPDRRARSRRRPKAKGADAEAPPMGDPDSLLPSSWREQ